MARQPPPPPPEDQRGGLRSTGVAAVALAGLVGTVMLVHLAQRWNLPLPFCGFRWLTGLPCPGCGSTRSLLAWTELRPLEALRFNPAFFALLTGTAAWALARLSDGFLGTRLSPTLNAGARHPWFFRIALALAALNWIYLCLTLPK